METVVMSVGGSLIVPERINTSFLADLRDLILEETGRRFVIITGGGQTSRNYQDAAKAISKPSTEDLDWIGIHATRLNGHLVRIIFHDIAHPIVLTNPDEVADVPKDTKLIVASGYRPGSSTDLRAVQIAERVGAKKVVNLTDVDHVYTDDPEKDPKAEKIEDITWTEFRKLIPEEWDPGQSSPFDPVAAKEAETLGLEVAVINGKNLEELRKYLNNDLFTGTRIHP